MTKIPLCVDLDGTFIQSDLLLESLLVFLKQNPGKILLLPFWLLKGKANLKRKIAESTHLNAATLLYHAEISDFLENARRDGTPLILATGSDHLLAKKVFDHSGIFSQLLASDGKQNLTSENKAARLVQEFGEGGFDYIGNSHQDLAVWKKARKSYVFSKNGMLLRRTKGSVERIPFKGESPSFLSSSIKALRPHQWSKNLLVFVPALASHRFSEPNVFFPALLAFISFSMTASAGYLINDLLDLESDRKHSKKKFRPLASGNLSVPSGLLLCVLMLAIGFGISLFLPSIFSVVLAIYFITSLTYSVYLKSLAMIDVFTLAGLYTIRIIAGHEAGQIKYSHWLLTFSLFMFLSLALVKRYSELLALSESSESKDGKIHGRNYQVSDRFQVGILGMASGQISVLILMLYLNSQDVSVLYASPKFMWAICPLILYWICRIWFLAGRGKVDQDPILFALKDKTSYLIGALTVLAAGLATLA